MGELLFLQEKEGLSYEPITSFAKFLFTSTRGPALNPTRASQWCLWQHYQLRGQGVAARSTDHPHVPQERRRPHVEPFAAHPLTDGTNLVPRAAFTGKLIIGKLSEFIGKLLDTSGTARQRDDGGSPL